MPLVTARRALVISSAALAISAINTVGGFVTRGTAIRANCHRAQLQSKYTYDALKRSDEVLPTLVYYKMHPDELQVALNLNEKLEEEFKPFECPQWWEIWKS